MVYISQQHNVEDRLECGDGMWGLVQNLGQRVNKSGVRKATHGKDI